MVEPKPKPKGWLERQIKMAQKEMEAWPQWMKDCATFEGSGRDDT